MILYDTSCDFSNSNEVDLLVDFNANERPLYDFLSCDHFELAIM